MKDDSRQFILVLGIFSLTTDKLENPFSSFHVVGKLDLKYWVAVPLTD